MPRKRTESKGKGGGGDRATSKQLWLIAKLGGDKEAASGMSKFEASAEITRLQAKQNEGKDVTRVNVVEHQEKKGVHKIICEIESGPRFSSYGNSLKHAMFEAHKQLQLRGQFSGKVYGYPENKEG